MTDNRLAARHAGADEPVTDTAYRRCLEAFGWTPGVEGWESVTELWAAAAQHPGENPIVVYGATLSEARHLVIRLVDHRESLRK